MGLFLFVLHAFVHGKEMVVAQSRQLSLGTQNVRRHVSRQLVCVGSVFVGDCFSLWRVAWLNHCQREFGRHGVEFSQGQ